MYLKPLTNGSMGVPSIVPIYRHALLGTDLYKRIQLVYLTHHIIMEVLLRLAETHSLYSWYSHDWVQYTFELDWLNRDSHSCYHVSLIAVRRRVKSRLWTSMSKRIVLYVVWKIDWVRMNVKWRFNALSSLIIKIKANKNFKKSMSKKSNLSKRRCRWC